MKYFFNPGKNVAVYQFLALICYGADDYLANFNILIFINLTILLFGQKRNLFFFKSGITKSKNLLKLNHEYFLTHKLLNLLILLWFFVLRVY